MCFGGGGGGSVSAKTEEIYDRDKIEYGDLPTLAVGDKKKRKDQGERMGDVTKPKKPSGVDGARSLLMPYSK